MFATLTGHVVPTVDDLAPKAFHHCMMLFRPNSMTRPSTLQVIAILHLSFMLRRRSHCLNDKWQYMWQIVSKKQKWPCLGLWQFSDPGTQSAAILWQESSDTMCHVDHLCGVLYDKFPPRGSPATNASGLTILPMGKSSVELSPIGGPLSYYHKRKGIVSSQHNLLRNLLLLWNSKLPNVD